MTRIRLCKNGGRCIVWFYWLFSVKIVKLIFGPVSTSGRRCFMVFWGENFTGIYECGETLFPWWDLFFRGKSFVRILLYLTLLCASLTIIVFWPHDALHASRLRGLIWNFLLCATNAHKATIRRRTQVQIEALTRSFQNSLKLYSVWRTYIIIIIK